uniref:Uncharacterized protein n=1 Tax=Arundo donax TaxID=35708 RepID=A0A0A9H4N9_ARUDO
MYSHHRYLCGVASLSLAARGFFFSRPRAVGAAPMSSRHLLPFLTALACRLPSSVLLLPPACVAIASSCSASKRWKS